MRRLIFLIIISLSTFAQAEERTFDFSYEAIYSGLKPGTQVQMWAPLPQSSPVQKVSRMRLSPPLRAKLASDQHGNRLLHMKGRVPKSGRLVFKVKAKIRRREWIPNGKAKAESGLVDLQEYLQADELVPITGEVLRLTKGLTEPESVYDSAHQLYLTVLSHMSYDKSNPGYGRGDSVFACDSRTGNCTDFHSLFLSLARSRQIPARFEIGYPLPAQRTSGAISGYHCWASFWDQARGWVPVDISEADKHPEKADYFFGAVDQNRVTLSVGRDLVFEPKQKSGPVNYFVRPLLEVEGKKIPAKTMVVSFKEIE